jgi:hypothetical protein
MRQNAVSILIAAIECWGARITCKGAAITYVVGELNDRSTVQRVCQGVDKVLTTTYPWHKYDRDHACA